MPSALLIRTAGTNCVDELERGFRLAGAATSVVHLDALIAEPARLDDFDLVGFPGGFSYGDDIASGRIKAMYVREKLYPALHAAIARGCAMIGVCNGFQVLVQVGLLPGPGAGKAWPETPPRQTLSLAENSDARFHDRWIPVAFREDSPCVWTRGLAGSMGEEAMRLPVAHGEGRLVAASEGVLDDLERRALAPIRYRENFNGSARAIAGVCDSTGRILGLMPHPERYLEWSRHPYWTRLPAAVRKGPTPGLRIFMNAVESVARMPV